MFTGIIESLGEIVKIEDQGSNRIFWFRSPISGDLKVDQSVSHNGICLTVDQLNTNLHRVTAVAETINRTELLHWTQGQLVNLERASSLQSRLDGHIVQGHVDDTIRCLSITDMGGSWMFEFSFDPIHKGLLVDKGSVCIQGVSLTVIHPMGNRFKVAIIPFTYENTAFKNLRVDDEVNVEFDIIGKYVQRNLAAYIK